MSEAIDLSRETSLEDLAEEQRLVLEGLIAVRGATQSSDWLRKKLEQDQASGQMVNMLQYIELLDLSPTPFYNVDASSYGDRTVARRERHILRSAYPSAPHERYDTRYIHKMFRSLPSLIDLRFNGPSKINPEHHNRRLKLYLSAYPYGEMAKLENLAPGSIHNWEHSFPQILGKYVPFFEVAQLTDLIDRAEEATIIS